MEDQKERAFSALIDEKLPMLRSVVYRLCRNESDTDDIIQSALLKAWEKYDTFNQKSQLSSWVCRIACNQAYDLFRKRQSEQVQLEHLSFKATIIEDREAMLDQFAAVEQAMRQLPEKLHAALNITIFEEIPTEEAAKILGCSQATVYWRVHKARKMIKNHLKNALANGGEA